jgi:hypothetical protein
LLGRQGSTLSSASEAYDADRDHLFVGVAAPLLMDRDAVVLAWHSQSFRLACALRHGTEFQSFFEDIMGKVDSTFVKIKPSGAEGDWKCDGWLPTSGTCFQVYAPQQLKVAETVAKIEVDFAGARKQWGGDMKVWIFVWSAEASGLPAAILDVLNRLQLKNDDVEVSQWGTDGLWQRARDLSEDDRIELFGVVPVLSEVISTSEHEVQALLTYLAEQPIPDVDEDLGLLGLEDKMDRNDFDDGVRLLIKASFPVITTVDHYVSNHPDTRFSQRVAVSLAERYEALLAELGTDPNAIFAGLVKGTAGEAPPESREYWAAIAIVAHYFELCDIFER